MTGRSVPLVNTTLGPVRGVNQPPVKVFKGIPYAAPPIGPLRWQPPQPPEPWNDPIDASEFRPAAPQTPDELELDPSAPQSEDCLTLNVWTPGADGARRPVMVWIHGGGFSWGSARNDLYDGSQFASRGDIVVVTIQYRLGAFGWLDLGPLGGTGGANNGLLDQIEALRWVKQNIAAFGGDPGAVTLAGESAGGISIGALMGCSQAEGLFHRAILQSGSPGLIATPSWAEQVTAVYAKHAKIATVDELCSLTTSQVLDAQQRLFDSRFADTAFHPVIDGQTITEAPIRRFASRSGPDVPTLIGTTFDEARYWILEDARLDQLPIGFIEPWLRAIAGARAEGIIETYRRTHPDYTDGQLGLAIAGDAAFRMPAIATAEALTASKTPVWMYLFTIASTRLDGRLGSPHAMDLPFTFNNVTASGAAGFIDAEAHDYQPHADTIQDAWIGFVRDGSPGTPALGDWPMYDTVRRSTMILGREPSLEDDPLEANRRSWGGIAFDGLTPRLGDSNPSTYEGTQYVRTALRLYARKARAVISSAVRPFWAKR